MKWQIIILTKFYLKNVRRNDFKTAHNHHLGGSYPTDCLKWRFIYILNNSKGRFSANIEVYLLMTILNDLFFDTVVIIYQCSVGYLYDEKMDIPKKYCWEIQYKIQCETFLYFANACYNLKRLGQLKYFILLQYTFSF